MNKNAKCCCKTIRSTAHLNIQYAHRCPWCGIALKDGVCPKCGYKKPKG